MTATPSALGTRADRARASPWFIGEGAVLVLLGVAAAALPLLAGLAGALVFGWVLIISGVMGFAMLIGSRDHTHAAFGAVSALVALVIGALILWRPLVGAIALAILLAAYLVIDGVALIGMGLDQRKRAARGWPWVVASGVIDILLGLFILALGPLAETTVLGFVIAIDLVVGGIALVALGLHARRA
jgi:uncharacterized membrane protein HdeD (DUF308 family)